MSNPAVLTGGMIARKRRGWVPDWLWWGCRRWRPAMALLSTHVHRYRGDLVLKGIYECDDCHAINYALEREHQEHEEARAKSSARDSPDGTTGADVGRSVAGARRGSHRSDNRRGQHG